jgi:hypothetical protein
MSMHYFSCSDGPGAVSIKSVMRHVAPNLFFPSGGICRSHSEVWCVRCMKHRRTIFHGRVARSSFHKKLIRTRYTEHVVLHPVGSMGHVVYSGATGYETLMYYFSCLGGPSAVSIKRK